MRSFHLALLAAIASSAGCAGTVVYEDRPTDVVVVREEARRSKAPRLGIPPGHLPPPGECRIWYPGAPPGQQPPPGRCSALEERLPAGAWLVHRSRRDPDRVYVSVCDEREPAEIVVVRVYDSENGRLLGEEDP